jgi:hypothetical protein
MVFLTTIARKRSVAALVPAGRSFKICKTCSHFYILFDSGVPIWYNTHRCRPAGAVVEERPVGRAAHGQFRSGELVIPGGPGKPSSPADVPERSCHMTNWLPEIRMSGSVRGRGCNPLAYSTSGGGDTPPSPKPEALRLLPPRTVPAARDWVARFGWSLSRLGGIMAACRWAFHNRN